jgi:hypothetical protein
MEGAEWHGRDAVAHSWQRQFESVFEHVRTDFVSFEAGPGGYLSRLRAYARAHGSGIELDWNAYFVTHIRGDLITEVWTFNHEAEARRQAGLDAE